MINTVEEYIQSVPESRSQSFLAIRNTILENLPEGYAEEISYGMIGYVVPLEVFPPGYRNSYKEPLPLLNLGSQKNYISLYHYGLYMNPVLMDWFVSEYRLMNYPHKQDIGKSCIRFKYPDEIPLELIGKLVTKIPVKDWIRDYEQITNTKKEEKK